MRKAKCSVFVNSPVGPVAKNGAVNRYTGNVVRSKAVDDGFIQWHAIPLIVFADVDPHDLSFSLALQSGLLRRRVLLSLFGRFDDGGVVHLNQPRTYHRLQFR